MTFLYALHYWKQPLERWIWLDSLIVWFSTEGQKTGKSLCGTEENMEPGIWLLHYIWLFCFLAWRILGFGDIWTTHPFITGLGMCHCLINNLSLTLIWSSDVACMVSHHYQLKALNRKKREAKICPLGNRQQCPGQRTFWQNTLLFKHLLTFCCLFVVVLNNIHKQRSTLEKVRILSNYHYWLLCLFSTKQMLTPCLRCQLPFSNSGPKFRKIKLLRYLLHSNALQVSRWPLGNTKDFLFCFIKRGVFRIIGHVLYSLYF